MPHFWLNRTLFEYAHLHVFQFRIGWQLDALLDALIILETELELGIPRRVLWEYVGSAGPRERDRLLGGALALLHLINFDEPFGLSPVEAIKYE